MEKVKFKVLIKNDKKQKIASIEGVTDQNFRPLYGDEEVTTAVIKLIGEIDGLRIGDTITIQRIK